MAHWIDDDLDEDGPAPWALGDDEPQPLDTWDSDDEDDRVGPGDAWLDEQLARLNPRSDVDGVAGGSDNDDSATSAGVGEPSWAGPDAGGGGVVLRHPAPSRAPRRRRADPDAVADLPAPVVPGYVRDRRGTWRYAATGETVPAGRDLTLRSLYRFPIHRGQVLVPVILARTEPELSWCVAWSHTLTTRLAGRRSTTVLRIPVGEWERRADVPFGLWAPELTASRLLSINDVARLSGVTGATITAYLSRRRMPPPVARLGHTPVWSRPVIAQWLASRPGQGTRSRR